MGDQLVDAQGNPIQKSESSESGNDSAAKPDDSKFATADSVAKIAEQVAGLADGVTRLMDRVAQPTQTPAQPTPIPDLPDDTVNQAIRAAEEGGNPAAAIRKIVDNAVKRGVQQVVEKEIRPLQEYGINNFAAFAEQNAVSLPKFRRFEKEIRGEIEKLAPNLRGLPQTWRYAYDMVVGRHADELANEAAEEAIRKAREEGPAANTPGVTPPEPAKLKDGSPVPTPTDLGGRVADEALRYKGYDQEALAQKLGYESWAAYIQATEELKDPYEDETFVKTGVRQTPQKSA